MADWYTSSVAYTALTQWAATTTLAVGAIRRQLAAPATNAERCFRVSAITTGITGASEPSPWTLTNNGTTADGGVTWTECTGQSNHQRDNGATTTWTAPAARLNCLSNATNGKNVLAAGDRMFLSSDHAETQSTANTLTATNATINSPLTVMSVAKTGSVPPVAADVANGASVTTTGTVNLGFSGMFYFLGATFTCGGSFTFAAAGNAAQYFKNCAFALTGTGGNLAINNLNLNLVFDNTTVQFSNAAQSMLTANQTLDFEWRNTPSAIQGGTFPTTLFTATNSGFAYIHGVDLSAIGSSNLVTWASASAIRFLFANCKLGSGFVFTTSTGTNFNSGRIDLIDCDSANTNYNNASAQRGGTITTEITIVRTGGATDGTTPVSHKFVSNANVNALAAQLVGLPIPTDFLYVTPGDVGVSMTATIQIISSVTLNNNDIWVDIEYPSSSSSPVSVIGTSNVANPLVTAAAVTASVAAWASSPATPVTQQLQVSFTPQKIGVIYAVVRLAKASTTVYVDPTITISVP